MVNLSLGGHGGPHDGTESDALAISQAFGPGKPGKVAVAAAGNEGNDKIHADGSVSTGPQTVSFTVPAGTTYVRLSVWYPSSDGFSFARAGPQGFSVGGIGPGQSRPSQPGFVECIGTSNTCFRVDHSGTQNANNSKEILLQIVPRSGASSIDVTGTWSFTLTGTSVTAGTFDAWISCQSASCEFPNGNTNKTVGSPAVGVNVIAVGSYVTKECWQAKAGGFCYNPSSRPPEGRISSFSSKGPTRDGRQKPEIAAPGQGIASARSKDSSYPDTRIIGPAEKHVLIQGTSMASPHVAGAVALLLDANPSLDAQQVKVLIQANAVKDSFTGTQCNNTWGCGKANIANIVVTAVLTPPELVAPANSAVLNTPRPLFDWKDSSGDVDNYRLQVTSGSLATPPFDVNVMLNPVTEFRPSGDLADAGYQWRVIATDKAANTASSVTRIFTIDATPPEPFELLAPASGDTRTNTPTFRWTAASGEVQSYRLQVTSGDITQGPYVIDTTIARPTTSDQTTLPLADATYRWRVIATDKALDTGASETRILTVDTLPPGPPVLLTPKPGQFTADPRPFLSWAGPQQDVFDYVLQVFSGDSQSGPMVLSKTILHPTTSDRPTADLAPFSYTWRVTARDRALNTASSPTGVLTCPQ